MSDVTAGPTTPDLQFDSVVRVDADPSLSKPSATCTACHRPLDDAYYEVNGVAVCADCRVTALSLAETPRGAVPLVKAGLLGLGAGMVGAVIYYAVIALANLEIGLVAILIGYMVGYAVRKGAGNRGGRRFQVLAIALTYASIAMAYTPLFIKEAVEARERDKQAAAAGKTAGTAVNAPADATDEGKKFGAGSVVLATAVLIGLMAVLPLIAIVGSLPSGLITAAIIFFGMRRAWAMTGAPVVNVSGPFRISTTVSAPA